MDVQVSAMYHIAQAIGGPPLPDCLSHEGRDFLRLCFNRCAIMPCWCSREPFKVHRCRAKADVACDSGMRSQSLPPRAPATTVVALTLSNDAPF